MNRLHSVILNILSIATFIAIASGLGACASPENKSAEKKVQVRTDCPELNSDCFQTLQAAIDAADTLPVEQRYTIHLRKNDYREKVRIDRDNIQLIAEPGTRLVNTLVAAHARAYHRDNWGTAGSATLTINAENIAVRNLIIENDFDYLNNDARDKNDPQRIKDSQAVALLLDISSDKVVLDNVELIAYQDTLFANGKRAYITNSKISGNVDFIFGNGQLLIENSEIIARTRGRKLKAGEFYGHITAPSTSIKNSIGIVFLNSRLTREKNVPDHSYSLGRPWHPTTTFPDGRYADPEAIGYTAYINCYMDKHIVPQAWTSMRGTARDGSKTRVFTPEESRFFESGSYGPGAYRENNRGKTIEVNQKELRDQFLKGWVRI